MLPYQTIIPIIGIPGFGTAAAERVCLDMKIQSQVGGNMIHAHGGVGSLGVGQWVGPPHSRLLRKTACALHASCCCATARQVNSLL